MPEYVGAFRTAAGRESRGGRPALSPAPASAAWRRFRDRKTAPFAFRLGLFLAGAGTGAGGVRGGHQEGLRDVQLFFRHLRAGFVCPDRRRNRDEAANVRFSALVKCGQNPMVAYTAAGFLIMPLLTLRICRPVCRPLPSYARGWAWRGACWSRPRLWPLRSFLRTAGFFGEPEFEL